VIYRRTIRLGTMRTIHGIEPDIVLPSGVNLEVVDYSTDFSSCRVILRTRRARRLLREVRGRDIEDIRDEWPERKAIIEGEEEV